jgi:hypothetical protein
MKKILIHGTLKIDLKGRWVFYIAPVILTVELGAATLIKLLAKGIPVESIEKSEHSSLLRNI